MNDAVDGAVGLEVGAAGHAALPVILDPVQQLIHQVLPQEETIFVQCDLV